MPTSRDLFRRVAHPTAKYLIAYYWRAFHRKHICFRVKYYQSYESWYRNIVGCFKDYIGWQMIILLPDDKKYHLYRRPTKQRDYQNGYHFAETFCNTFLGRNIFYLFKTSLNFGPKGTIDNEAMSNIYSSDSLERSHSLNMWWTISEVG